MKHFKTTYFYILYFWITDDEDDIQSPRILRHVELIDDEAAEYGIKIVKTSDLLMAKKYGYRNPPGITYFRKGNTRYLYNFYLNFFLNK